jgi:outer membrane protein OmpA-like peptidoglycan-associated protein
MSIVRPAAFAAILLCAGSTGAFSASSKLQLILGGEAYDGPPKFEVSFDGKLLGEGIVSDAIDTASAGRFADATDKTPYVQSFEFEVPEKLFKPGGEVRVRLVNEAYGGEGSNRDRNLYLAAVTLNGRSVTVSGLETRGTKADQQNELLGEFLVLRDGNMEGVSRAPADGWPAPEAALALARLKPEPKAETAADAPADVASVTPPAIVAKLKVPTVAAEPEAKPVEVAAMATEAVTAPPAAEFADCNRDELYNVIGFNENSNDLTPKLEARLKQIIADIGPQKCKVLVTGYSSKQGNHATNALFAIERAQNVLAYLKQAGLSFEKATATGGGATEQFGEEFSVNRRVVISVSP